MNAPRGTSAPKWTPGEKDYASAQVDSMADVTPHKTFAGALALVSTELACQRNALRDALNRLRPLLWEDIKRGHGLFSDEDLEVTDAALTKCNSPAPRRRKEKTCKQKF